MLKKIITSVHKSTKRNYLQRVNSIDKSEAAKKAIKWGYDYWDGSRKTGYGGYYYDGRWKKVASELIKNYKLKPKFKILDVGCGKGFLLHDLKELIPELEVYGLDISKYALRKAMPSIKKKCVFGSAEKLPFKSNFFDLVISINTLHNLYNYQLGSALNEISRVSKNNAFICIEAYRNEKEKMNLMYWQLTCRAILKPEEWKHLFKVNSYKSDYEFIYFN
tara:strand:+ start:62 stop:721 length:660 start_codon:yes stop_codon:yes gene_type:complete